MTHRWEAVLDTQADLFQFLRSDFGRRFIQSYGEVAGKGGGEALAKFYRQLPAYCEMSVWHADPIYVDEEMMLLAEEASKHFKPEPLIAEDLLIPAGFMSLPHPWYIIDRRDKRIAVRYISWYPTTFRPVVGGLEEPLPVEDAKGIVVCFWTDRRDPDDYPTVPQAAHNDYVTLSHVFPWGYNMEFPDAPEEGSGMHHLKDRLAPFIQTMWRIMAQTIVVRAPERASKPFRKRYAKAGFPDRSVTVIKLRRAREDSQSDGEGRDVAWSHRWIVSGHFRNQWFPSAQIHRQVWIHGYIKGPKDRPLEVRKLRVFEFVR